MLDIEFTRLYSEERGMPFEIYKAYMKPIIDDAFGWDEEFQRNGFESNLDPDWFSWVLVEDKGKTKKAGLTCSRYKRRSLHIHLLVVFAEEQRKGIATSVVKKLKAQAYAENTHLTLNCFKNNVPALNLYRNLGFVINSEDEHFYRFIFKKQS